MWYLPNSLSESSEPVLGAAGPGLIGVTSLAADGGEKHAGTEIKNRLELNSFK